ncbi:hypothetical protein BH23ACT2_BH23ACT2_23970 [soil metagenome]
MAVDRLISTGDAREIYRTLGALLDAGYLAGDRGGSDGVGLLRVTPAGRRCLVAAAARLGDQQPALAEVSGSRAWDPELLLAHRSSVFAIGRPAAPSPAGTADAPAAALTATRRPVG